MKKLLAILLTIVILMSMGATAFATEISGDTTKDVTASYTPSDSPSITGLSITIDGVQYTAETATSAEPVTIYADSTVIVTLYGVNFDKIADADLAFTYFGSNYDAVCIDSWLIDIVNHTASITIDSDRMSIFAYATSAAELKYTNDGWATTDTGSGVYVIYSSSTKPAEPTYTITIDSNITNGTVTADFTEAKEGEIIKLTFAGLGDYELDILTVADEGGVELTLTDVCLTTKTFVMPASAVNVTATFKKIDTLSAEISWGSMNFTYSDEQVELADGSTVDKGWSTDGTNDAGTVTVKNTDETKITVTVSYTQAEGYTEINGYFDTTVNPPSASKSYAIDVSEDKNFELTLSGKPEKAIAEGTIIGSVTITIGPWSEDVDGDCDMCSD